MYVVTAPAEVPDPLLTVHRTRRASIDGVSEEIRIGSALREPVDVDLELVLGLDRTPMEQIKSGRTSPDRPQPSGPRWSWRDDDTTAEVTVDGGTADVRGSEVAVRWQVHLSPGASQVTVAWSLRAEDAAAPILGTTAPPVPTPVLDTSDQRLQRLADRAFSDLNSLRIADRSLPDAVFLAAGAPWFYTMFGRDSIIAARMLLPGRPVARRGHAARARGTSGHEGRRGDGRAARQDPARGAAYRCLPRLRGLPPAAGLLRHHRRDPAVDQPAARHLARRHARRRGRGAARQPRGGADVAR